MNMSNLFLSFGTRVRLVSIGCKFKRQFSYFLPKLQKLITTTGANTNTNLNLSQYKPISSDDFNEELPYQAKTSLDFKFEEYSEKQHHLIDDFKSNQQPISCLIDQFKSSGFASPTLESITELVSSDSLEAVKQQQEQYNRSANESVIDEIPSWTPYKKDEEILTQYEDAFRVTKTSDFLWSLQNQMFKLKDTDDYIQQRFNYLNHCMTLVNEQKHILFAIDTKIIHKELREIGIAIYDPTVNKNSTFPTLERYHIIIEELHGVLSTNSYHGDSIKLPAKEAFRFVNYLIEKHHVLENSPKKAKFIGHSVIDSIKALKKHGVILPTSKDDIFDTYLLYMIPFLYHQHLKTEIPLKVSTFLELDTILKRLYIPFSDIHNVGNRAYFTIFVLLTITNPYNRVKFKLDNIDNNLKYMESFLTAELEDILRSWNTKSHVSVETSAHIKQYQSKQFDTANKALYEVYNKFR